MQTTLRPFLPLAVVIAVHAAALTLLGRAGFTPPQIEEPETMEVALVEPVALPLAAPTPAAPSAPPAPKPREPEPERPREQPRPQPQRPEPTPRAEPEPEPEPVATAPAPSAITAPAPAPVAPSAPTAPVAPSQPASARAEASGSDGPVTPPSSSAAHLRNPAPAYPLAAQRAGEAGRVVLSVYILADGSVGDLKLKRSSGYKRLDDAAEQAVRKWKFVPAKRGGTAVAAWVDQPIPFVLNEDE